MFIWYWFAPVIIVIYLHAVVHRRPGQEGYCIVLFHRTYGASWAVCMFLHGGYFCERNADGRGLLPDFEEGGELFIASPRVRRPQLEKELAVYWRCVRRLEGIWELGLNGWEKIRRLARLRVTRFRVSRLVHASVSN